MNDSLDQKIEFCTPLIEFVVENIEGETFIDVGAHVGGFCIPLMLNSNFEKCYAFEPNPSSAKELEENAKKYGCDIEVFNKALMNGVGVSELRVPIDADSGLATLGSPKRYNKWEDVYVETDTLDTCGIDDGVGLIKIDTEGAELMVLLGGQEFIKKHQPPILLELLAANTTQLGYMPEQVHKVLSHLGYWVRAVTKRDYLAHTSCF